MSARRFVRRRPSFLLVLVLAATVLVPAAAAAAPTELFFSEYIEGSSNNKALEIFNGTGAAVDLAGGAYSVQMYFNGSSSAGLTINLSGTVASGDVFVLAHASADPAILAQADQTNGAGWFNGDDAVVLRKGISSLDVIGQVGVDPGVEWGSGLTSTQDNTLRRRDGIEAGDPDGSDAFDPSVEWDGFAQNTFDGLGAHGAVENAPVVADCGPALVTDEGTAATTSVGASDADGTVVDIAITEVSPSPAPGTISLSNLVPASGAGGTATADVTVDAATPAGSYSVQVTATNDDASPQTGVCTLSVQVQAPPVPISEIQGSGATSPHAGTQQRTSGVVTVVTGNGIFVQDPAGDGDPSTSDGIFVFLGSSASGFAPGQTVDVSGTVVEFRSSSRPRDLTLTEFSSATATVTGAAALPAPVAIADRPDEVIAPDGIDAFERLEGMLVSVEDPLVVGPTNRFGEIVVVASGDAANATANGNMLLRPLPGDQVDYNPERVFLDDEARFGGGSSARINDPMVEAAVGEVASGDVVGAMDYQFSNYRVQANHAVSDVLAGSLPPSPVGGLREAAPYEGRVATFNVENLFDCVDAPGKDDRTSCSSSDLTALETQLTKLAKALEEELDTPELIVVEEVENTEVLTGDVGGFVPGTTVPALLPRVAGTPYDAVSFDASDGRGIEVGFVYDTGRVVLHDAYLSTAVLPDGAGLFDGSGGYGAGREPLVGAFTLDDVDLTVVGLHLKSKGGPQFGVDPTEQPAGDDPLYGEFQPPTRWTEELRHQQGDYVRDLVDLLLAGDPGSNVMVAGDLNDFEFGEPGEGAHTLARIQDSPTDPLANLVLAEDPDSRYSFIFDGNSQQLDHMLVNAPLEARHREQAGAHFNAGFPASLGSDPSVTFRSSDHDPLVGYFCTDATAPSLSVTASPDELWPPNHRYRMVTTTVTAGDDRDPAVDVSLVSVTSNEPDDGEDDGDTVNDVVIVDDTTFRLRAERSGTGTGRVYTITYAAVDACGNETVASAEVRVPLEL